MHEWTTLAIRQEDVVFEGDEAMGCGFGLDDFGVAASTLEDQFVCNQFFM